MAFGYDGSVRIKADLNHSPFDRGLSSMTKQVNTFGNTLKKIGGLVAMAFGTAAIVNFAKESVKAASALNDAWMGLESIVTGQGKSFSKAKSFINDYISDGLVPLENAVTSYKNLAARGYTTEQIEKVMSALKDSAAFGRQSSYTLGEAVQTATEGLKNENSILVDNAGVTKNVAKMWDEYAKSIGTTANKLTQEQKIQAEVNGILQETRFQTGDAAKLVNTYSGQIALLGYNFQNLKVQVGNAIMPIVQAVLPGINAIISALTKLATVFAQVTALLFGKSAQVKATDGIAASAGAAAAATDKLADSTAGAGSAAKQAEKDMKGVLASFDELNILANRASDSGGGGGGGGDGGIDAAVPEIPSFESEIEDTNQLAEAFGSLGELFIKTLDDMIAAIPGFRDALLEFAGNFNEFNQKLYDAFTFPGVLDRVKQLGHDLADAFNDLVLAIDWELWGRTLGAGLNLGLNFLTSFIYEFDWISLGQSLASFINGLVYEVDWYEFGRLLWAQFKIALETFAGFILGLDMPALAKAASDIIMGFFDSMKETIANIDWAEIGRQIAEFLNNIDWAGVINSIAGAIGEMIPAALDLIGGFISNADPATLLVAALFLGKKLIGKLISSVLGPIAKEIASNLIKKIAESITAGGASALISTALKGVLGGISVAVGISIVVSSIKDITVNGANFKNVVSGLIGGALAGAGVGFMLGGPGGAALGAVIGVGLTLSLEGVASQIANGVDIFGALSTIIGTTFAGAGIGFAVGNLPGAAVGAIIGLTAGIVLEITGIKAAGESAYAATEDFQFMTDIIKECEESSNRSSAAMQTLAENVDGLTSSLADVGAAQALVDEIYAINDNAAASAQELELMATKVELLNSMGLDGLHLSIDETTGRILETKEATDQLIISLQKEAETAALQELLVQAYKDRYQAVMDAEKATKSVDEAEKALAETEKNLMNTPWWDLQKHSELTAQQEKQTEALEAATDARDKAVAAYNDLSGAIDTYSVSLTNLSAPEANVGVELEKRMDSVRSTVEGVANDMPDYGKNIGEGLEKGMSDGITEKETKNIFQRIGDWFKNLFGIHSPSTVFKDFGGNLAKGLFNGLDENISPVEKLFSDLWGNIKTDSEGTWGDVQHSWDGAGTWFEKNVTNPIKNFFSGLWDGIGKAASDAWDGIKRTFSNVGSWFSNNVTSKLRAPSAGRAASYSLPETATYSLPRLANGAVIPPNQQFAAVLGDQRSGKNLEAPAGLIRQMVAEGIQAAGGVGRSNGNMTIIMEIDGREFGRASYKYGTAEQQRVGVRLAEVRS